MQISRLKHRSDGMRIGGMIRTYFSPEGRFDVPRVQSTI